MKALSQNIRPLIDRLQIASRRYERIVGEFGRAATALAKMCADNPTVKAVGLTVSDIAPDAFSVQFLDRSIHATLSFEVADSGTPRGRIVFVDTSLEDVIDSVTFLHDGTCELADPDGQVFSLEDALLDVVLQVLELSLKPRPQDFRGSAPESS